MKFFKKIHSFKVRYHTSPKRESLEKRDQMLIQSLSKMDETKQLMLATKDEEKEEQRGKLFLQLNEIDNSI